MTKEEYFKRVGEIDQKVLDLYEAKRKLQEAYLEEIAEFKKGDKVLVDGVPAVVTMRTMFYDEPLYEFKKLKKDGTVSNRSVYYTLNSIIKKL